MQEEDFQKNVLGEKLEIYNTLKDLEILPLILVLILNKDPDK